MKFVPSMLAVLLLLFEFDRVTFAGASCNWLALVTLAERNAVHGFSPALSPAVPADISTGLVGHWQFDESSGTTAADSSGNNYTGILNDDSVTWTTGRLGNALDFDGANDYVNVADDNAFSVNTTNQLTVSAWINRRDMTGSDMTVTKGSGGNYEWYIETRADGRVFASIMQSSGTGFLSATTPASLVVADQWYHLAFTVDLSVPSLKVYLNGVERASDTTATGTYINGTAPVRIGERADSSGDTNGLIDDVRIYNRTLSAADVAELADSIVADTTPPTVSISAPVNGATVSGTSAAVTANASDNVGVVGVQFRLDGVNLGAEDTTSPYSIMWDTTTASNASHTLTAVARDTSGNSRTSTAVTITVSNTNPPPPPPPATILWSAGMETGDMSEWYLPYQGGEFNSGNAVSGASTDIAHSGSWSARGVITTPPGAAVRLFRWKESYENPEAYYSAWFYFPQNMTTSWNNILQFKSRNSANVNDPFWSLLVRNRPNGNMYITLSWWGELWTRYGVEGPHQGEFGWYTYHQTTSDLPVGQWVHIEAFLRQSSAFAGQITVWQDGIEIHSQDNVKTRHPPSSYSGANALSINNYGDHVAPSPYTIYFDDVVISTARVGTASPPPPDTNQPGVNLTAPTDGATASGSAVTVAATAVDDVAVVGVQFTLDGINLGAEDLTTPYSITWNTTTTPNGPHTLAATARDAAGNINSSTIHVTVDNPVNYFPHAYTISNGSYVSGNMASLTSDDGDYFAVRSTTSGTRRTTTDYELTVNQASRLDCSVRLSSSAASTPVIIYAFNYATSTWTQIRNATVGTAETTLTASITSSAANYISNNRMLLRIHTSKASTNHTISNELIRVAATP